MMHAHSIERSGQPRRARSHTAILLLLSLGLAVALAGNLYQFVQSERMQRDLVLLEQSTQRQMAKLTGTAAATLEENQQRFEAIRNQLREATAASLKLAKSEAKRASSQVQQKLEQKHQGVVSQLSGMKRARGDLGVMSREVATSGRNYFEFALTKTKEPQTVGDIRMLLKKTDPKRNRYTLEILAGEKIVEKKDRTINEPVQLYVAGGRQPYEIVVNEVKKNEVVGYLATPKVRVARGEASE